MHKCLIGLATQEQLLMFISIQGQLGIDLHELLTFLMQSLRCLQHSEKILTLTQMKPTFFNEAFNTGD